MTTKGTPAKGPDASPGFHLWHAALAWKSAVAAVLEELTPTQFFALGAVGWIGKRQGPPSQREVAEVAGLDAMTTSQVVRALAERDLIVRQDDPNDSRAFRLVLTQKGARALEQASAAVRSVDQQFFAAAGDAEEIAAIRSVLEGLARQRQR